MLELWISSRVAPTVTDRTEALRSLLRFDPDALLVAVRNDSPIGTLLVAWNGWRGSFYRLVVRPEHRREGLGTLLVREGERRLRARGAVRLDAIVDTEDVAAMRFWDALGYARQNDRSRFVRNLRPR